jgi:hypothetical protein
VDEMINPNLNFFFWHKQTQYISLLKRVSIQRGVESKIVRLDKEYAALARVWATIFAW